MTLVTPSSPAEPQPPVAPPGPAPTLAPVADAERLTVVDTLRGFALLGVLIINLGVFSRPLFLSSLGALPAGGPVDDAVTRLTYLLVEGKFYAIFSFLFGVGFFLQLERSQARTGSFSSLFARRLAVLLGIGAVHATLVFSGDILVPYALLGFSLLILQKVPSRWLKLLIAGLLMAPPMILGGLTALLSLLQHVPEARAKLSEAYAQQGQEMRQEIDRAFQVYGSGSWLDTVAYRLHELPTIYSSGIITAYLIVLAMFLLGLWVGRTGLLQQPELHPRFLRRAGLIALGVGLTLSGVATSMHGTLPLYLLTWGSFLQLSTFLLSGPLLGFAYVCGLTLLLRHEGWRQRLSPLAAVGRLSLSNYLLQSLVCTTLFYGYGFGLFGETGPLLNLIIAFTLYAAQVALSLWWTRRFRFGPAEWLWRSLTYGQRQPMRLRA